MTAFAIGHPLSILKDRVFCGIPVLRESSASDRNSPLNSIDRFLTKLVCFIASVIGTPRVSLFRNVSSLTPDRRASSERQTFSPFSSILHDVDKWLCCSSLVAHLQLSLKYPSVASIRSIDSPLAASPMSAKKLSNDFHLSHTVIPTAPYAAYAGAFLFRHLCNMLFHVRYVLLRVCFVFPPWPCFVLLKTALQDREQYLPLPTDSFDWYVENVAPQTGQVLNIGIADSVLKTMHKITQNYVNGKIAEKGPQ